MLITLNHLEDQPWCPILVAQVSVTYTAQLKAVTTIADHTEDFNYHPHKHADTHTHTNMQTHTQKTKLTEDLNYHKHTHSHTHTHTHIHTHTHVRGRTHACTLGRIHKTSNSFGLCKILICFCVRTAASCTHGLLRTDRMLHVLTYGIRCDTDEIATHSFNGPLCEQKMHVNSLMWCFTV